MSVVAIQIDGCRSDYIASWKTHFLFSLREMGLSGTLMPTFGFEPDAAYLAALYPDECDGGMHFWYDPDNSHFKIARMLPKWVDKAPQLVQLGLRRLIRCYVGKSTDYPRIRYAPQSCRIPFRYLPYFDIAEKHLFDDTHFAAGRGIFSLLKRQNKRYFMHSAPTHPTAVEKVLRDVEQADHPFDFIFLHIGDLDSIGHKYGPHSTEIERALRRVDDAVRQIFEFLGNIYDELSLVTFGDHGMVQVRTCVDMAERLSALPFCPGKDYLYFLDSTFARFWFFSKRAEIEITTLLEGIEEGRILTQTEKNYYHLNYSHNRFGDLIFLANPGFLIFPNFWNNTVPEKGMHGYTPEYEGQQSGFLIHSPKVKRPNRIDYPVDMRRIFPTLLELLDMPITKGTRVKSILFDQN